MASGLRDKRVRSICEGTPRTHTGTRSTVALSALLLGACQAGCSDAPRASGLGVPTGSSGFTSSGSSGATAAGSGGTVGSGAVSSGGKFIGPDPGDSAAGDTFIDPIVPRCTSNVVQSSLQAQLLTNDAPMRQVLYSWTTPEQVEELRRDRQLFVRSEQAGAGRGFAFTAIERIASGSADATQELAGLLTGDLFAKIRYAWPNPWATRLGFPGEDYGNQLLRIVLKASAWTVLVNHGLLIVRDMSGNAVPLSTAIATPERIGAIFFVKDEVFGGGGCGPGTFQATASNATYREFILGNEAMIEEWSLATPEILQRLSDDIVSLNEFFDSLRQCSDPVPPFGAEAGCLWSTGRSTTSPLVASYIGALSMASDYYLPRSAEVAHLIETLEADLFEPDPLLVKPGE